VGTVDRDSRRAFGSVTAVEGIQLY
jgi:hypothetical protein